MEKSWPIPKTGSLRDRLCLTTQALVDVPSVYGNESDLANRVEAWAQTVVGSFVRRIGNSLAIGNLEDSRPTLALVGHLDTVSPPSGSMEESRVEKERLFGLGSTDMKGGVAVMCALLEDLDLASLPYNVVLALYEKEEGPHEDSGLKLLLNEVQGLGSIDLAFCMEPTNNVLQMGCVGGLHATVTFSGKAAHSARPWQGENAVHKGGAFLAELHERQRVRVEFEGLEFFEVVHATKAHGGESRTTLPDRFELNVNYRFAPGKSLETAEAELSEMVAGRGTIEITDRAPSGRLCFDNQWLQAFQKGAGLTFEAKQAWTDVARLSEAGVDAVNFGPGDPAQAHQVGEWVSLDALVESYEVLKKFLEGGA